MPALINHSVRALKSSSKLKLVEKMANRRNDPNEYKFGRNHHVNLKKGKGKKNQQNHKSMSSFGSNKYGNDSSYKVIDLHNSALHQAKERIKDELRDAYSDSMPGVKFIHGFNHGTAIRDWLRSEPFQQFIAAKKMTANIWYNKEGVTNVSFGTIF